MMLSAKLAEIEHLECDSKIKKWAFENAYTLTFLGILFFLTWIIYGVTTFLLHGGTNVCT